MRERPQGVRRRGSTSDTADDVSRRHSGPDPAGGGRGPGPAAGNGARNIVRASVPSPRAVGHEDVAVADDRWTANGDGRPVTATPERSTAAAGHALVGVTWSPLPSAMIDVPAPPLHDRRTHRAEAKNRRRVVVPQRAGAILLALVLVGGAAWYVPHVAAVDAATVAGTVANGNIVDLNFGGTGQLSNTKVHVGQSVRRRQVLATEHAPLTDATVTADRRAVVADHSRLAVLKPHAATNPVEVADAYAQLAKAENTLAVDRAKLAQSEIVAPVAGTVAAINGQQDETVDPNGLRNYPSQSKGTATRQQPLFSLLPEGPRAALRDPQASAALPVIVLRTAPGR